MTTIEPESRPPLPGPKCSRRISGRRCKTRLLAKPAYEILVCPECGAVYPDRNPASAGENAGRDLR